MLCSVNGKYLCFVSQAKKHLSEKERVDVAKSMCHDPGTAERFYVSLPDKTQSFATRKLRLKAMKSAIKEAENTDDQSSLDTDTEVKYDDRPVSSSSEQQSAENDEDELTSYQNRPVKRRLVMQQQRTNSKKRKAAITTKECTVSIEWLRKPLFEYFLDKMKNKWPLLNKEKKGLGQSSLKRVDHTYANAWPATSKRVEEQTVSI